MRQYIIASIIIILGLVIQSIKVEIGVNSPYYPYISDLPSTLLITGMITLLFKIFQDKETFSKIRDLFKIHEGIEKIGLKQIYESVNNFNFEEIVENSDSLYVVMNDGERWIGNQIVSIEKRLSKKSEFHLFLVDPDSPFIEILSKKTNTSSDKIKDKIKTSLSRLKEAYSKVDGKGKIVVYGINTFPTKSIFITESVLVETPYQVSSGRVTIPLYIYSKVNYENSIYGFVKNDIEALKKESKILWDSSMKENEG